MNGPRLSPDRASVGRTLLILARIAAGMLLAWIVVGAAIALARNRPAVFPLGTLLLSAALYAASHLMRIARLALLVGNARLSLRHLAAFHLYSAGIGLGMPWRLGEIYRAVELGRTLYRVPAGPTLQTPPAFSLGLTFVWIERLFDAALLCPVLVTLVVWRVLDRPGAHPSEYGPVLIITLLFVVVSVLIVGLLPDNLRRVGTYLIRRHEGAWTVPLLRVIDDVRIAMRRVPALLAGRVPSLLVISVLVWLLELASVATVLSAFDGPMRPVQGLLTFLSQATAGNTLPRLLPVAGSVLFLYLLATQIPLALVAVWAGISHTLRFDVSGIR